MTRRPAKLQDSMAYPPRAMRDGNDEIVRLAAERLIASTFRPSL
jgi:hypothetical protein